MKFTVKSAMLLIRLLFVVLLAAFMLFFLNGMHMHTIKAAELEKTFLEKVKESGLEAGEIVKADAHENSKTLLFKNAKGELACITYSKSIYSSKWREEKFYTSAMSVFNNNEVTYDVNDKRLVYPVTCRITENPAVEYGEVKSVVLSVKAFGICVILLAACIGRFVGMKRHRRI